MEAAAQMLTNRQKTIKEVAICCGYTGDQSSFSKLFKSIYRWRLRNGYACVCTITVDVQKTKIKKVHLVQQVNTDAHGF